MFLIFRVKRNFENENLKGGNILVFIWPNFGVKRIGGNENLTKGESIREIFGEGQKRGCRAVFVFNSKKIDIGSYIN